MRIATTSPVPPIAAAIACLVTQVARVAGDVESGDAGDGPKAVAHERRDRQQQHEVETPNERRDIDRVARPERDPLATGVDDHQSVFTRVWVWALTPKNRSNTRRAAGAAAVEP